jgi:hypothetical protein
MKELWRLVDVLLRDREAVSSEEALGRMRVPSLAVVILLLGAAYGIFMGVYGLSSREVAEYRQIVSSMWKVPALFLLTLLICFPSLYVFSTLLGSRLSFVATLKTLLGIVAITVTVLASFGPIVAFFSLSTENYSFMKLLNVAFFAVAGLLGVGALLKALRFLLGPPPLPTTGDTPPVIGQRSAVGEDRQIKRVFRIWILIYALVGAQMGWVLRPFIGDPHSPFAWFRARQANFFIDVWQTILKLFS